MTVNPARLIGVSGLPRAGSTLLCQLLAQLILHATVFGQDTAPKMLGGT